MKGVPISSRERAKVLSMYTEGFCHVWEWACILIDPTPVTSTQSFVGHNIVDIPLVTRVALTVNDSGIVTEKVLHSVCLAQRTTNINLTHTHAKHSAQHRFTTCQIVNPLCNCSCIFRCIQRHWRQSSQKPNSVSEERIPSAIRETAN